MIKPVSVIYPEGGEPLYEDNSGLRLTAQDFAIAYGYETTKTFLDSLNEPIRIKIKKTKEAEIDG